MGNQGMGGPGAGRNPFGGQGGPMSEEDKKKARERRQEECKNLYSQSVLLTEWFSVMMI